MKTHKIATALFHQEWAVFAKMVIPPWVDGWQDKELEIKGHFLNAKEVIGQRDALTEMWPAKKEEYRRQCEEVICGLAQKIQDAVSLDAL